MSKTLYREVEIEVSELAEFIFKRNINNAILELSLGGIENNKDMFYFILDLFCKGLVLMFGDGTNSVDVDSITYDDFKMIQEKMLCAGIKVNLSYYPLDIGIQEDLVNNKKTVLNLDEIQRASDNLPLEQYEFKLLSLKRQHIVSFELVHRMI